MTREMLEVIFERNAVVFEIVKAGHLALYQILHEKKLHCTNYTANSDQYSVFYMLDYAFNGKHMALVHYIINSIDAVNGAVLIAIAEAAVLKDFDTILGSLNQLLQTPILSRILKAILPRDTVIFEIAKTGHLALYKAIHEKGLDCTNYAVEPDSVSRMLRYAMEAKHQSLVNYIVNCMSPGNESSLLVIVEAVQLGNFDLALERLNALPQDLLILGILEVIFDRNIVHEIARQGHLPLYQALHEKKLRWTNHETDAHSVSYVVYVACHHRQHELAAYILEQVRSNTGNVFNVMIKSAKSGDFDNALNLLNQLSNILPNDLNPPYIFRTVFEMSRLINEVIAAGHLELYKAIYKDENSRDIDCLRCVIDSKQESMALYILETFKPSETDCQSLLLKAKESGLINVAAKLLSLQMPVQAMQPESGSVQLIFGSGPGAVSSTLETKTALEEAVSVGIVVQAVETPAVPATNVLSEVSTVHEATEKSGVKLSAPTTDRSF